MLRSEKLKRKITLILILFSAFFTLISSKIFANIAPANGEGIHVYHKNLHLSAMHKQKLAADILHYRNADNLWNILRENFTLRHYENQPAVRNKINWFMNNQIFLLQSASRAAPYLYYISQQVKKRHLPAEFVLLPIIESGYNPFAISSMGASGIWQMMPGTATGLGVKQDAWYDGRRDFIASTQAALNYILYLQDFFEGNWLLAIAAYDTGAGNVRAAIKRNIREGRRTDFWSLPLARETKDYVPSLLALAIIISHPEEYPVYLPPVRNAPYLGQVEVSQHINLKYAASLAGLTFKKFSQLNAGFNRNSAKGPYKLVLPIENVERFAENLARSPHNTKNLWLHYQVKSGDTLISVSRKFNTSVAAIRKMNHLSSNSLSKGAHLLIPEKKDASPSMQIARQEIINKQHKIAFQNNKHMPPRIVMKKILNLPSVAKAYQLQPGDTIYMVRNHDTVATIAKRFKIPIKVIVSANRLAIHDMQPGKHLIIPTHPNINHAENSIQPGDTIYIVRKGDTIEKIARKFSINPAVIRLANLIDENSLREGEKLVVPTHFRS